MGSFFCGSHVVVVFTVSISRGDHQSDVQYGTVRRLVRPARPDVSGELVPRVSFWNFITYLHLRSSIDEKAALFHDCISPC